MGGQHHAPAALPPEKTGTYFIGSRVGLRAPLDGMENLASTQTPPLYHPDRNELLY
jgi:hypothetical protein